MKRIGLSLTSAGAVVLIGAVVLWSISRPSQKPLAQADLGDGRILRVEAVTYGQDHRVGNRASSLIARLTGWLPAKWRKRLEPSNPETRINTRPDPALVIWVTAVSAQYGTNVDCQSLRMELVNARGERFWDEACWFGADKFWRVGHIFRVYPRDEPQLRIEATPWKTNLTSRMEISNPHVVRPAAWSGADLPQRKDFGNLSVLLAGLQLVTNGASVTRSTITSIVNWEPVWELRAGERLAQGWSLPEWRAEDALGNRGQLLGTNQPALRFSATFYPTATNSAALLLAALPQTTVTNLQSPIYWNQTVRHEASVITALGIFPPGSRAFEDGVLATNQPATAMSVVGGAPSGWIWSAQAVNPLRVVQHQVHYSTRDMVIYVSAPDFRGTARLGLRLRDERGRNWPATPESQEFRNGIFPFLINLPPEVSSVTPELVLLNPLEAEFMVKMPSAGGSP